MLNACCYICFFIIFSPFLNYFTLVLLLLIIFIKLFLMFNLFYDIVKYMYSFMNEEFLLKRMVVFHKKNIYNET